MQPASAAGQQSSSSTTPRSSSHCPTGSCVASTSHASPPRGPTPSFRCKASVCLQFCPNKLLGKTRVLRHLFSLYALQNSRGHSQAMSSLLREGSSSLEVGPRHLISPERESQECQKLHLQALSSPLGSLGFHPARGSQQGPGAGRPSLWPQQVAFCCELWGVLCRPQGLSPKPVPPY